MTCHLGASQVLCSAAAESARNLEAPGQFIRLRALISPQHKPENLGSYFCQPSCQPDLRKLGFQPERLIFHVASTQAWILFCTLACSAYVKLILRRNCSGNFSSVRCAGVLQPLEDEATAWRPQGSVAAPVRCSGVSLTARTERLGKATPDLTSSA